MRRHAQVRLDAFQESDHRTGVQPVQRQAPPRMKPRLVRALVEQAHQLRRAPHHRYISFAVNALKKSAHVLESVNVFHGAIAPRQESFFKSLRGANVSRAGRCGQQQYARLRFHFLGIPAEASGITLSCAGPRQFFPEFPVRFFAVPRTASGSPENRDLEAARPAGPASSAESCHAVLRDAEAAPLPAIPRAPSWRRSDTWLPPAQKFFLGIVLSYRRNRESPEKWGKKSYAAFAAAGTNS